ncbi:MAG: TonB-dependent receptor [Prevotellaceae bacterium]|jgi:hypothetical protein|nr:TonB-dependent receptor [Prevotellaceae bacterium]
MKRTILLWVLGLSTALLFAQQQPHTITVAGSVIEGDSNQPAIQATVQLLSLPDSTMVTGVATESNGQFSLPKVAPGKYVLKISYVGYVTHNAPIQLNSSPTSVNVGRVVLNENTVLLEEAVITAQAPPVQVKGDTISYSAAAYRTQEGAMLEDLVKKMPGVEVSDNGTVTLNGRDISKILVDGKEFFSDDPTVALKNLPADMVENVKTYERQSDNARLTGIDDGQQENVLDLTVKKGMKEGWVGTFAAGLGNKQRYEVTANINQFQDDNTLTFIGGANNTNSRGSGEFGDSGAGMGRGRAGTGVTASRTLGMNFAREIKNIEFGGNIQYGYSNNDALTQSYTDQTLANETSMYGNSNFGYNRVRHDLRADIRMEWTIDSLTTVIFRPNVSWSKTKSNSSNTSEQATDEAFTQLINRQNSGSMGRNDNLSLNGRLELYRKFGKSGRNFTVRGNFGYSDGENDAWEQSLTESRRTALSTGLDSLYKYYRYTDGASGNGNYSISASYTEPLFKNHFLQAEYQFSHQKRDSRSYVYDIKEYDFIMGILPDLSDLQRTDSVSSEVENYFDQHRIGISLTGIHTDKMMYNIGVRMTPQISKSHTLVGPYETVHQDIGYGEGVVKQNVTNFSPNAMFRYNFNRQHMLMVRYSGQTSAPGVNDLKSVIDISDPMNESYGNPDLKPSFSQNIMMTYNRYFATSMLSYNANIFYARTDDNIANIRVVDPVNGANLSKRANINGNWNLGGFLGFSTPLKNQRFTIMSNANVMINESVSYEGNTDVEGYSKEAFLENPIEFATLSKMRSLRLGERLRGNYRANTWDISLNAGIDYSLTRNNINSNVNRETYDYTLGGNTNITFPWGINFSTDINWRIKEGYSGDLNKPELLWNAQLSKSFLRGNAAMLRVRFYDILQQQTNLSRTTSAAMTTDSQTNMLGSYFMVSLVYRLNTLGGQQMRNQRRMQRGDFQPGQRPMDPPPGGGPPAGGPPGGGRPGGFGGGGGFGGPR